jgi:four helix bundle protein
LGILDFGLPGGGMNEAIFKQRTKDFGNRTAAICDSLPQRRSADAIARQLVRSGFSVGANYRAACRAKSRRDMAAKLAIVEEELDESVYWLEVIIEQGLLPRASLEGLMSEGNELLAMTVASIKTLRSSQG